MDLRAKYQLKTFVDPFYKYQLKTFTMNQSQRNFLTDKIEASTKEQIKVLENRKPERPNLSNYLLHKIMSNDFEIKSTEELMAHLIDRAINAKDGKDWNSVERNHWSESKNIGFKFKDFFVIPEEFKEKIDAYERECKNIRDEVHAIQSKSDTLIVRIKLASNSTLESMIKEVDDMGNIQLMDTKLKALQ